MTAPAIILITGASAAGKSTVAQAVAERLPKAVHLRGDAFRKMIVSGRAEATGPRLSDDFIGQLNLRYEIACEVAERYVRAGFQVVYQDVILGPPLETIARRLSPLGLAVVVLDPDPAVVAVREAGRGKTAYRGGWTPEGMVAGLRAETARIGLWIDTSAMSAAETAEVILTRLVEARVAA